jgi:hypothetical protein
MPTVLVNINVDKELWDELKIACIKNDTTITDVLIEYIKQYVNENK